MRRSARAGRRWWGAAALVAALVTGTTAQSQTYPLRLVGGRFTVEAFEGDSLLAASMLRWAAGRDTFPGLPRPREQVLITVAPDSRAFAEAVGPNAPEWGAAFAFPDERRIVMQGRGAPSTAGDPAIVLRHELAHLALFEYFQRDVPRWFDEGYASYAAGEWTREQVIAANVGLALGRFRTLASLDSGFRAGSQGAAASYALSYRAVAELAALDPVRGLALLMEHWKRTGSLDLALRSAHGLTTGSFETRWMKRTRRRYGALALFADVTIGAGLLLVMIVPLYILRRRRDRARLEALRAAEAEAARREQAAVIEALLASLDAPERGPTNSS